MLHPTRMLLRWGCVLVQPFPKRLLKGWELCNKI